MLPEHGNHALSIGPLSVCSLLAIPTFPPLSLPHTLFCNQEMGCGAVPPPGSYTPQAVEVNFAPLKVCPPPSSWELRGPP